MNFEGKAKSIYLLFMAIDDYFRYSDTEKLKTFMNRVNKLETEPYIKLTLYDDFVITVGGIYCDMIIIKNEKNNKHEEDIKIEKSFFKREIDGKSFVNILEEIYQESIKKREEIKNTEHLKYAKCCNHCHLFINNYDDEQTGTCLSDDIITSCYAVCENFTLHPAYEEDGPKLELCYPTPYEKE